MPEPSYEYRRAKMLEARAKAPGKGVKKPHRKEKGPVITKENLLKAIKGTAGIKMRIARRLGVGWCAVQNALHRPGWEDTLQAWQEEREKGVDIAENAIMTAMKQKDDLFLATINARWFLEKRSQATYGKKSEVTVQGGDSPLKMQTNVVNVDTLNLPLEVRKQLLQAMDEKITQQNATQDVTQQNTTQVTAHESSSKKRKVITIRRRNK